MRSNPHRRFLDLALRDRLARSPGNPGLTAREQHALAAHLAACQDCGRRITAMDERLALLAALPELEPPADLAPAVLARLGITDTPAGKQSPIPGSGSKTATLFRRLDRIGSLRLAAGFLPLVLVSALLFHGALPLQDTRSARSAMGSGAAPDAYYGFLEDRMQPAAQDARAETIRRAAAEQLGLDPAGIRASVRLHTNYRRVTRPAASPPHPHDAPAPAEKAKLAEPPRPANPDPETDSRARTTRTAIPADAMKSPMENPPLPMMDPPTVVQAESSERDKDSRTDGEDETAKKTAGDNGALGGFGKIGGGEPAPADQAPVPEGHATRTPRERGERPADNTHRTGRRVAQPVAEITLYVPARGTSRLETQELKRRLTGLFPTGTRLHLAVETAPAAGGQAALPEERESAPRSGFPLALCGWLLIEALFRTFFWLDGRRLRAPWKVLVPALALGSLFVFPWLYWRRKRSA